MDGCLPGLVLRHPPWSLDEIPEGQGKIPCKAPHQMRPNPVLQWVAAQQKGIVFCLYVLVILPQVKERKNS